MRCGRSWLAGLAVVLATSAPAAPREHDLGQGLRLYRIHALPADLPPAPAAGTRPAPCVVDVRFLPADEAAATALIAWLKFRAQPRAPVFVLANAGTSPAVLRALAGRERGAGIVVVGPPGRLLEPDSAVRVGADDERRAYDALEQGAAPAALVTDHPDKVRNDEASLSRDRVADASVEAASEAAGAGRPSPPIDASLQRAVHLHRALTALRRL